MIRATTVAIQRRDKHLYNNRGAVFSAWSLPSFLEDNGRHSSVAGYSPDSNDVSTEAAELSLLGSVTRKRLLEILQKNSHC
jgi:hypothetical protein